MHEDFHPAQIIIDATNSRYQNTAMDEGCCADAGVECHAVTEHGAFQKEF